MNNFDWEYARKNRNPAVTEWLRDNFDKPITEKEFVESIKPLKVNSRGVKGWRLSKRYNNSHLRHNYKYLKKAFGFFE